MAYPKPRGYKYAGLINGAAGYKPNNNFLSGNMNYAPGAPTLKSITYNFVGAPANNSTLTVQDGPPNSPGAPTKTFTFTWAGAPGVGVIPLVAGGGTAAQAAVAAAAVLSGQLTKWTTTVAGTAITMTQLQKGVNATTTPSSSPNSNMSAVTGSSAAFTPTLPGRTRVGGFLSGV